MAAPHIFIVDNEKDVLLLLSFRLKSNGFTVSSAESGEEALEFLKKNSPDLIVLDLLMPGMDGYEVLGKIRSTEHTRNLPVIMLTGKHDQADMIKALNMGLDDYITKPYEPEELIARIKTVLKRSTPQPLKKIKNILITGGAGFIGSALARELLKKRYKVTVMDDFSTGRENNIKDFLGNPDFRLVTGSITDETLVSKAVEQCDLIYHLAATVGVKKVVGTPLDTIIYDVLGTHTILKYASSRRVKVVLTSTSETYGKSQNYPFREDDDVVIGPPGVNRWSYSCSKLLDEFLAKAYHDERGLPVVIVRLFNVVGPRQVGSYGMVIPRFLRSALTHKAIQVYGDGTQSRCFTYIDDAVDIIIKLADNEKANGEVINLGSDNPISIKELALLVKRVTKSSSEIAFAPYCKYYGTHFEDIQKRVPDLTKLKAIAGLTPQTSIEEIVERTAHYLKDNPDELNSIQLPESSENLCGELPGAKDR